MRIENCDNLVKVFRGLLLTLILSNFAFTFLVWLDISTLKSTISYMKAKIEMLEYRIQ